MANRSLDAKLRKDRMRNKKRVYGTQSINTGKGPTAEHRNAVLLGQGLRGRIDPREAYWNTIFPGLWNSDESMKERNNPSDGIRRANPVPRGEVLATLDNMMSEVDVKLKYALVNRPSRRVDLFFNIQGTSFFILETDILHGVVRQSHTYVNKHVAETAYKINQVRWKTIVKTDK